MFKRFISCGSNYQVTPLDSFSIRQASASGVELDDDFLYVTARAVSAGEFHGPNTNGDYFGLEELRRTYNTFMNRGAFVNHQSNDVEKCRGRVCATQMVEVPGKEAWVKLLIGVDQKAFPQLARAIRKKYVRDVSMGATVGYSFCSVCGNRAHTDLQRCAHLQNYKGSTFGGKKVWEDNRGVNFFEISFVVDGADPDADILGVHETLSAAALAAQPQLVTASRAQIKEASYSQMRQYASNQLKDLKLEPGAFRQVLAAKFPNSSREDREILTQAYSQKELTFSFSMDNSILRNILNS